MPRYDDSCFGDFPTDHQVNYVWTEIYTGMYKAGIAKYKAGVGTSNEYTDFASETGKNSFFEQSDRSAWLTTAAPVIANAKLNQQAIDLMPADMVSAVNAIGGFKNTADGTITQTVTEPDYAAPATPASDGINVTVNGVAVQWTDVAPFIDENSRTMVPLRAVADAMNLNVGWFPATRVATFNNGTNAISFPIDSTTAGGVTPTAESAIEMDTATVIVNDRTYAPIRYLAEFFGYTVSWDAASHTVVITG